MKIVKEGTSCMEKSIAELNAILKGECMAIHSYERFIENVEDEGVKAEFEKIVQDHERHADEVAGRIKALGGKPNRNTGLAGVMASMKMAVENIGTRETVDVLKDAYDGEDKGIAMAEEIVKGDLDGESAGLVNRILSEDHGHLRRIARIISKYEIGD